MKKALGLMAMWRLRIFAECLACCWSRTQAESDTALDEGMCHRLPQFRTLRRSLESCTLTLGLVQAAKMAAAGNHRNWTLVG